MQISIGLNSYQKRFRIKGWSPAKKNSPSPSKKKNSSIPSPSKSVLKKRLEKALSESENEPEEEAINRLLDEASSQSDDNGEMLKPKDLARSYINPFD